MELNLYGFILLMLLIVQTNASDDEYRLLKVFLFIACVLYQKYYNFRI